MVSAQDPAIPPTAPTNSSQDTVDLSPDAKLPNAAIVAATTASQDTVALSPVVPTPNAATAIAQGEPAVTEAPPRRDPLLALQHRDFRLLWAGGVVSQR